MSLVATGKVKRRDLELVGKYEKKLVEICKSMNIPDDVVEHAKSILHHVFLFHFDLVVTRLRISPNLVLGAIVELASNDLGFYFSTKAFCRRFGVAGGKMRKLVVRLSRALGVPKDFEISRAVKYYARRLELSYEEEFELRSIVERIDKEPHEYQRLLVALVVFLKNRKGMTHEEVAKVLNVTIKSIERYVKRAKTIYGFEISNCHAEKRDRSKE